MSEAFPSVGPGAEPSTRGRLLVATPALLDPNFEKTVVFMLEHGQEGALGLVLNRPSQLPVAGTLDDWDPVTADPPVMFVGGPVSPSSVIALAVVDDGTPLPTETAIWTPIVGRLGTVDLEHTPDDVPGLARVRMFAGFASWAPGQLDAELVEEAWFVVDAELPDAGERGDIHTDDPEELWWEVLARQPEPLRHLRNYPRDVGLN